MSKTIWYVSKYSSVPKYGPASRNYYLAREFNKLGHRTILIASDSNHLADIPRFASVYTKEIVDGVETWWIRTLRYKKTASIRRLLSWLDFEIKLWLMPKSGLPKPDVVIASSLSLLTALSGYWLRKRYGCRFLFEVRDIWPLTLTEEGGFHRWHPLTAALGWVERFGYRKADVVVGTMPNLAEHVRAVTGKDIRCECVPIGCDPAVLERSEALPEGYEDEYLPKGKFIVGHAGSIGLTNALDTIVACARRMKDNQRIHFAFVGDGGMLAEYKRQVGGQGNVSFAPKLRKAQVSSFLKRCDVLYFSVMNSRVWAYGQSLNKVIDYMYAAKPIVASYSGYPSMINEAQCGLFVPAGDVDALEAAILRFERTPGEELNRVGEQGKRWLLENRQYEKIALEYSQLF
jgi:glycosyltransferase involved in cell wall biosynthesis